MAGRKNAAHRFFAQSIDGAVTADGEDFEESDVWGAYEIAEPRSDPDPVRSKPIRSTARKQRPEKADRVTATASMPVNIPDWSKILKDEYRGSCGGGGGSFFDSEDDDEVAVTGAVIPPHVLLWRSRGASFSVHEGIGRTLKGRDLSRVRNAIFQKTGFED